MEILYYVDEKINEKGRKGSYVPISAKLYREGESGFVYAEPYRMLSSQLLLNERIKEGIPVYILTYIQHSGKDEQVTYGLDEHEMRRYIDAFRRAIERQQHVEYVDVHYESGKQNLKTLLTNMPMNTYTSFRTPTDTFSFALIKIE